MKTLQRYLGAALGVVFVLLLTGCGGPNLIDRFGNFWSYGICSAIVVILDIIALVEVFGSEKRTTGDKILWTLVIVFFPLGGLILYYMFGRE
jgi:hypothetical protein